MRHFILATRAATVEADLDENGIIIEDGETGERLYQWNGTHSFWRWGEPDESDSESSVSDCMFDMESVASSMTDYSDESEDADLDMPPLSTVDDNDEEDESDDEDNKVDSEMSLLTSIDSDDDKDIEITCDVEPEEWCHAHDVATHVNL